MHLPNNKSPAPTASVKDLSTPHCPAEVRAWLLIHQKRFGQGKPLTEAFNRQFPGREDHHVYHHAARVRDCDAAVQSRLLDLAKGFSWYEDPPREGGRNYKRMKMLEKRQEIRDMMKSRDLTRVEGLAKGGVAAGSEGQEIP